MRDPLPEWNKHVRQFGAKHQIRLRIAEDGEIRLLLGPRTTENHASIHHQEGKTWVWAVYYTAPSSNRVAESVKALAKRNVPLEGEGFYEVTEQNLLRSCALNRWLKPRFKKVVGQRAREDAQLDRFVQALDGDE